MRLDFNIYFLFEKQAFNWLWKIIGIQTETLFCVQEAARIIYMVHDEVKDKMFELELSWVGEFSNGVHQRVPEDVHAEAERFAKAALEEDSDSDDEDMS